MNIDNIFLWLIQVEKKFDSSKPVSESYFDRVIYTGYKKYNLYTKTSLLYSILLLYRLTRAPDEYRTQQKIYDPASCYSPIPTNQKYPTLQLTRENFKKIWTVCLMIASKFVDDGHYDNETYAGLTHSSLRELNKWEINILNTLRYNLYFKPDELDEIYDLIEEEIK